MASAEATPAAKSNLQKFFAELRRPTNTGGRVIRYSLIAVAVGTLYFKEVRPGMTEYKYCREEDFANYLFEKEQRNSEP